MVCGAMTNYFPWTSYSAVQSQKALQVSRYCLLTLQSTATMSTPSHDVRVLSRRELVLQCDSPLESLIQPCDYYY